MSDPTGPARSRTWRSWSGAAGCAPALLIRPATEADVVAGMLLAADRGLTVRAVGTGHSFNALACTDGMLIDLSGYAGVLAIDDSARTITVRGGTTLRAVSAVLDRRGLALASIGTLAEQTVAGAISTGNHGTGLTHQPLASQVVALRLVTADGTVRTPDERSDPDLLACAATSLGALGVITEVTLRCVPQFNLRVAFGREPLPALLERIEAWAGSADFVAFNWLPWTDQVVTRAMSVTATPRSSGLARRRHGRTLEELRCGSIGLAARLAPWSVPRLNGALASAREPSDYVDTSQHVFCFRQPTRFLALEHALPLASLAPATRALGDLLRRIGQYSPYSMLGRVGAADGIPLSMSYGRATGYLNLTVPRAAGYLEIFRSAEHLLREYGGRPHWAKAHTANADILAPRYPEWDRFQQTRAALDPDGRLTSDYLARVLGPVRSPAAAVAGTSTTAAGHRGG